MQVHAKPVQASGPPIFSAMEKEIEAYYLQRCLYQIELSFCRGASDTWRTFDFEKLSEAIYAQTAVRLSVTTLKRVWGKLPYHSVPTLTTLNTLVQFCGYEDWRDFTQYVDKHPWPEEDPIPGPAIPAMPPQRWKRPIGGLVLGMVVALLCFIGFFFFFSGAGDTARYQPDQFEFRANKIQTEGVPNSVVFQYQAHVKPDSLFIVQTWDITRKTLVPVDGQFHSAIYYYPGFFRTRLIADDQIVKTHDLWITTDGWLCMQDREPVPIYFEKQQCQREGVVAVDEAMLAPYRQPGDNPQIRFFNQRDLGDLMNDHFTFETTVKNDFDENTNTCHYTEILIQCKDAIIILPLAARPCVGDLSLFFCGTYVQSKSADLSGFGCDLTQWTTLRVETVDKHATIFVNDKEAYALSFSQDPTGIVGVQYRFTGAAAVKDTRFTAHGKVYEMD